ncbi:hypothetical protein VR010_01420 [Actinomycetaceae bacterium L2_0104]
MEPRYQLRTTSQYGMTLAFGALALVILVLQLVQVGTNGLFFTVVFCLGICLIAVALWLLPCLEVNASGVIIANSFTTTTIPYSDLLAVESRWGMKLTTKAGRSYSVRSFGTSASSRGQNRRPSPSKKPGEAAAYVPGARIPVLSSGTMRLRTTTYAASALIEDLWEEYRPRKKVAMQAATQRYWAWDRIAILALGAACMVVSTNALFN